MCFTRRVTKHKPVVWQSIHNSIGAERQKSWIHGYVHRDIVLKKHYVFTNTEGTRCHEQCKFYIRRRRSIIRQSCIRSCFGIMVDDLAVLFWPHRRGATASQHVNQYMSWSCMRVRGDNEDTRYMFHSFIHFVFSIETFSRYVVLLFSAYSHLLDQSLNWLKHSRMLWQ